MTILLRNFGRVTDLGEKSGMPETEENIIVRGAYSKVHVRMNRYRMELLQRSFQFTLVV